MVEDTKATMATTGDEKYDPHAAVAFCSYCGHPLDPEAVFCPACGKRVEGAVECDDYVYEAFISYRHVSPDREVAVRIQRKLEGFRIPRQLRSEGRPTRLGRLFRDEDELPTSASLSDQIRDALKRSRFLIVMCSPKTNESRWVAKEIELFSSFHGRDRVRLALVEGEPEESFPELLRSRVTYDWSGTRIEVEEEPLAADFRDRSRKHFNVEVLRLAAPLIGCGFDDLRQRIRARTTRLVAAISSGIAAVSLAFSGFSMYQQAQIERNYRQAQINESEYLATESADLLSQGRRMEAIQVALAALPKSSSDTSRPFVPAAQLALENALGYYPSNDYWRSVYDFPASTASLYSCGDARTFAYEGADGNVKVMDLIERLPRCSVGVSSALGGDFSGYFSRGILKELQVVGNRIVCSNEAAVCCIDIDAGSVVWQQYAQSVGDTVFTWDVTASEEASLVATVADEHGLDGADRSVVVRLFDLVTGEARGEYRLPSDVILGVWFCFDGTRLAVVLSDGGSSTLHMLDVATGDDVTVALASPYVESIASYEDVLFVSTSDLLWVKSTLRAYDDSLGQLWSLEVTNMDQGSGAEEIDGPGSSRMQQFVVHEVLADYGVQGSQALATIGNRLYLLDMDDGTTTCTVITTSPILAYRLHEDSDKSWASVLCQDGTVVQRKLFTDYDITRYDNSETKYSINLGTIAGGMIVEDGMGGAYLISRADEPARFNVYSSALDKNLVEGEQGSAFDFFESGSNIVFAGDLVLGINAQDKCLVVCDRQSFELKYRVPLPDVFWKGGIVSPGACSILVTPGGKVLVSNTYGQLAVVEAKTGTLVGSYSMPGGELAPTDIVPSMLPDGSEVFLIAMDAGDAEGHTVYVADDFEGYGRSATVRPGTGNLEVPIGLVEGAKLLLLEDTVSDPTPTLRLVDVSSGEEISCDLNGARLLEEGLFSYDGRRICAVLLDHSTACFDVQTGALCWKVDADPSRAVFVELVGDDGDVLAQDETGIVMLRSHSDGAIIQASSTKLPKILSAEVVETDVFADCGRGTGGGVAVICTDRDQFGPVSFVANAFGLSTDGQKALLDSDIVHNSSWRHLVVGWDEPAPVVVSCKDLDQLIEMAHDKIAGFELTSDQLELLRIGS